MEIKLPIDAKSQMILTQIKDSPLALKIGQIVDVNVLQTKQDIQTLTLELAHKTLQLQSNQPIEASIGDKLQLEVTRLKPELEFKLVLTPPNASTSQAKPPVQEKNQTGPIVLKTPTSLLDNKGGTANNSLQPRQPLLLNITAPVTVKVIAVSENQIHLQLPAQSMESKTRPSIQLTLDRTTAALLKPGQTVLLEPGRIGNTPAVQLTLPDKPAKIAESIKQNLPIHQSPVQLIDQLIKDLPDLWQTESIPATLKRLAQEIIQNLPSRQQITHGALLKEAASQSGLFLEAQLAAPEKTSILPPANDFKAQLLKLIEVLKPSMEPQMETESKPAELEQLKILLQKTESSVAKIVLDQLASLPKDEGAQQSWHLEIPYLDDGKAESVNIQIERDDQNDPSSDSQSWAVTMTITPPNLGTLHCKVSYQNGTINTHFWSQQRSITQLIKLNIDVLRKQLENSGLKTGFMDALEGEPVSAKYRGHSGETLLDEQA